MNTNNLATTIFKAFAFWAIFQAILLASDAIFPGPSMPKWLIGIFVGTILSLVVVLITHLFLKYDELNFDDLGMTLHFSSLVKGFVSLVVGLVLFAIFYYVYSVFTPLIFSSIEGVNLLKTVLLILVIFLALSTMEELVFRGYFLKKLETGIGIRGAIYITSIAFGLYHGLTLESITGPAIWGLLYGVLFYWSKGLAVPIGFHAGVNITQALFNQKTKWIDGIWTIELADGPVLMSIEQVTILLQSVLLIIGVALIEYYIRVVRPNENLNDL